MEQIKYNIDYLMDMVDVYLNTDFKDKNTSNGKNLTAMFNNDQPIRPINQSKYADMFRIFQQDCQKYHHLTSKNIPELKAILGKIMENENYITLSSEIIKGEEPMEDVEHEFIVTVRGENLPDVVSNIYERLMNYEIPFKMVAKVKNQPDCVYEISVLTNDEYYEKTRAFFQFLNLDELLVNKKVFGCKVFDYVEYDNLNLETGKSSTAVVGNIVVKAIINSIGLWSSEHPDVTIYGTKIYDYLKNAVNKDEAIVSVCRFINVSGDDLKTTIRKIIENSLVKEGLNPDNVFEYMKYAKSYEVREAKEKYDRELQEQVVESEPIVETTLVENKTEEEVVEDKKVYENEVVDEGPVIPPFAELTPENPIKPEIAEAIVDAVHKSDNDEFVKTIIVEQPVIKHEEEIKTQGESTIEEHDEMTKEEQKEEVEAKELEVDDDIKAITDEYLRLEETKSLSEKTNEEQKGEMLSKEETDALVEEALLVQDIEKYQGLVKLQDVNVQVANGQNLIEYLESNKTLSLIPINAIIMLDDGTTMSGYEFIEKRVIPAAIRLGHTSVQETIDKYVSDIQLMKEEPKKKKLFSFFRK